MVLREEVRRRLLADRGIHVTEACDRCGQVLGAVRWMRRGEPGVWCSRACPLSARETAEKFSLPNPADFVIAYTQSVMNGGGRYVLRRPAAS